jgi:bifunctional non-homologous end joining protein LigD
MRLRGARRHGTCKKNVMKALGRKRPAHAIAAALPGARPGYLPDRMQPQLPARASSVPVGDQWLHEKKLEGSRLLARVTAGGVQLFDAEHRWRLPPLERALTRLPVGAALLDGQLVAFEADGTASIRQMRETVAAGKLNRLCYHAFDLLHLDGYDLSDVELRGRKHVLQQLLCASSPAVRGAVRYTSHFEGNGTALFEEICRLGLPGMVSKLGTARYRSGVSSDWLDVACAIPAARDLCEPTRVLPRLVSRGLLRSQRRPAGHDRT